MEIICLLQITNVITERAPVDLLLSEMVNSEEAVFSFHSNVHVRIKMDMGGSKQHVH